MKGAAAAGAAHLPATETGVANETTQGGGAQVGRTKAEWRAVLPPDAFDVLFEEGTERAGTSPLNGEKRAGTFVCAACHNPLFRSDTKYESGTGWPSFFRPLDGALATKRDFKLFWPRTEYHCARCGGHQGHVFDDGPEPTGQRYCNNGVALRFVPDGEPLPPLVG
jgi:peptide-methionine (R)-S-oxide reductase